MDRRGFIGGLVGLATGATVVKTTQPVLEVQPTRVRQVIVDQRDYRDWFNSREGEQVFINYLKQHKSIAQCIGKV